MTQAPASATTAGGSARRWLLEFLPAYAVALLLLPWIISDGTALPWQPAMIDLDVYVLAARDLLAGRDIYETLSAAFLPFIYPPIAAILMAPIAVLPGPVIELLWTALTVAAQILILARAGVRRGRQLAVINVVLVVAVEPFRTTIGYGQVNTLLMALVVADLLPDRAGERRWLPRGTLIGLAAAIKLTPLIFLVFAWFTGRRRIAVTGVLTVAALTAVGAALQWRATATFIRKVVTGDTYGNPLYVGNQSLASVFVRLSGDAPMWSAIGQLAGLVVALGALLAAVLIWKLGHRVLAVGLVGLASCVASPLSWTHHHVWAVLVGLGALLPARQEFGPAQADPARPLPGWLRAPCLVWTVWVAMCPVLAFLPYGEGIEVGYTPGQHVVGALLPVLSVLITALALAWTLRAPDSRRTPAGDALPEGSAGGAVATG